VFKSVPSRLAKLLLTIGQKTGMADLKAGKAEVHLSQQILSEHLGVTRESVNKVLSKWEEAGYVKLGRGRIGIADAESLEGIASPE
jgi:CRP-like cAMP-binding protein